MIRFVAVFLLSFSTAAFSGQLHLAVIQFPEAKTAAQLDEALKGVSLDGLTNSNRTMTKVSFLKGGYVIFSQSFPAAARFKSATRLSNNRADVEGSLANGKIGVSIVLSEGVAAGLRRFSQRTFHGSSNLKPGQPHVVGIRQITEKTRQVSRGDISIKQTDYCSVIIAQLVE